MVSDFKTGGLNKKVNQPPSTTRLVVRLTKIRQKITRGATLLRLRIL